MNQGERRGRHWRKARVRVSNTDNLGSKRSGEKGRAGMKEM